VTRDFLLLRVSIGRLLGLFTVRQYLLTWSAVLIGLGLALGFFREAFRPRIGFEESSDKNKSSENDRRLP
jgi:hypothetical protein